MSTHQLEQAGVLVSALMDSRKRDPAFNISYPGGWDGDVKLFAEIAADVAGLSGTERDQFAVAVAGFVSVQVDPPT